MHKKYLTYNSEWDYMLNTNVRSYLQKKIRNDILFYLPFSDKTGSELFDKMTAGQKKNKIVWSGTSDQMEGYFTLIKDQRTFWGVDLSLPFDEIQKIIEKIKRADKKNVIVYGYIPTSFLQTDTAKYIDTLNMLIGTLDRRFHVRYHHSQESKYCEIIAFLQEKERLAIAIDDKDIKNHYSGHFNYIISGPCSNMLSPVIYASGQARLCSLGKMEMPAENGKKVDLTNWRTIFESDVLLSVKYVMTMSLGPFRLLMLLMHYCKEQIKERIFPQDYDILIYFYSQIESEIGKSVWPPIKISGEVSDRMKARGMGNEVIDNVLEIKSLCFFCELLNKYALDDLFAQEPFNQITVNNIASLYIISQQQ